MFGLVKPLTQLAGAKLPALLHVNNHQSGLCIAVFENGKFREFKNNDN